MWKHFFKSFSEVFHPAWSGSTENPFILLPCFVFKLGWKHNIVDVFLSSDISHDSFMTHKGYLLTTVNSDSSAAALSLSSYCFIPEKPSDSEHSADQWYNIYCVIGYIGSKVSRRRRSCDWESVKVWSKSFVLPVNATKAYLQKNFRKALLGDLKKPLA